MKNKLNQINQFNGGMVKDVEPLMVPNTVMTDCLNGTLITYNGNEFALQNDMGNYGFKNGGLSNGFVPVGMKEHQGVLYIISYNPIDNKVEIGSFPSQQTIFTPTVKDKESALEDITFDKTDFYNNLEKQTKITIFSKDSEFYLKPGDKYLLVMKGDDEEEKLSFKEIIDHINETAYWKHLVPYILTDENKLYNVDGFLELQADKSIENRSDYIPISWDIPGWLAVKYNITVPEQFNIYFDKSSISIENSTEDDKKIINVYPSGDLKVQTYWNFVNYSNTDIENIQKNLVYFIHKPQIIDPDYINTDIENIVIKEGNSTVTYNSFQSIICNTISVTNIKDKDGWYITPALLVEVEKKNEETGETEKESKYIIYSQFTQKISRNPVKIIPGDIKFGEDYFKYFVGDDSLTIVSSWESFPGVNLEYSLERYSTTDNSKRYTAIAWTKVSDLISNGTIIIDVPFSVNNEDAIYKLNSEGEYQLDKEEKKIIDSVNFNKEDVYFLKVRYTIDLQDKGSEKIAEKEMPCPIYATEVINRWYYIEDNFKNIDGQKILDYSTDYISLELDSDNYKFTENYFLKYECGEEEGSVKDYEFNTTGYINNLKLVYPKELDPTYNSSNYGIKTIYKQGAKYSIENLDGNLVYILIRPKDQNGEVGRLWRHFEENKINDGKVIDSKGNTYTLTFDENKKSFSFDLFNTFVITNSETNFTKEVSVKDKFLYEYHPIGKTNTRVEKDKIFYSPEYVEFRKDAHVGDRWSMCFWRKNINPLEITFSAEKNILTCTNGEITFENWPKELGDLRLSDTNNWSRTGFKPDGDGATKVKGYADDYGFNIYNFYNNYDSETGVYGISDSYGEYKSRNNFSIGMSYETENSWPCIYYCSNKAPSNINNSEIAKVCIYSYLMLIYCLRYCVLSESKIHYYSLYNYKESLISPVYVKKINLSGTYEWKYFMEKNEETLKDIDVPTEIEKWFKEETKYIDISTITNVNFNCITSIDEKFREGIQSKVSETNDNVKKYVDNMKSSPNISSGNLYLISEYDETKNKVKLNNVLKSLVYTNQIRSNISDALELRMVRDRKNDSRSVAREFFGKLYNNETE